MTFLGEQHSDMGLRRQWHIRPRRFCVLSGRSLCVAVVCIEVFEDLSLLAVGGACAFHLLRVFRVLTPFFCFFRRPESRVGVLGSFN